MAIYQDKESAKIYTDFGNGESLTLYLKEEAQGAGAVDEILERFQTSEMIQSRITSLKKQISDVATPHAKLAELQQQIKELQPQAKNVGEIVGLICAIGARWDNYASEGAEQAGEPPVPLNAANVRLIHPSRLVRIMENISLYMKMDDEAGKSNSAISPAPLLKEVAHPSAIPVGIFVSKNSSQSEGI